MASVLILAIKILSELFPLSFGSLQAKKKYLLNFCQDQVNHSLLDFQFSRLLAFLGD